jgi:hypothetical protein
MKSLAVVIALLVLRASCALASPNLSDAQRQRLQQREIVVLDDLPEG